MCQHQTPCPSAEAVDREAARILAAFPEQGWSLLCNGVILFDDTGEILPGYTESVPHYEVLEPHRGPAGHVLAA